MLKGPDFVERGIPMFDTFLGARKVIIEYKFGG